MNKPRERRADAPAKARSPANSQEGHSTPCTGRATYTDKPPALPAGFVQPAGRAPRDSINLSALPRAERPVVWRGIQRENPALAELLQADPVVHGLRTRLGAGVEISQDEYARYYQAGKEENDV